MGIKKACECNEYGFLVVKHPQNGTPEEAKPTRNTTPATRESLAHQRRAFFIHGLKLA
jgi:hypothetical protein